jgi:hypothetical protein
MTGKYGKMHKADSQDRELEPEQIHPDAKRGGVDRICKVTVTRHEILWCQAGTDTRR